MSGGSLGSVYPNLCWYICVNANCIRFNIMIPDVYGDLI